MPLIMFVSSSFNTYVNLPKKKRILCQNLNLTLLGSYHNVKPYQWPILHWVKKWSNTCLKSRVWIFQMWTKTNMYSFHHDSRKWFLKIAIYQPFLLAKLEWIFQGTLWRLGFIASKERKTQVQMVFEGLLCV